MPQPMTKKEILNLYKDPALSAEWAGLRYTSDEKPGITRKKAGTGFYYLNSKDEKITDEKTLDRIKKLVIPPAWTEVWIANTPRGHLQATGRDDKGRKQYIYHPEWQNARNLTKFGRMITFGKSLPALRKQIQKDIQLRTLDKRKVTALVLSIMDNALIRIGNRHYAKSNKSFGLTTLRDRHVTFKGDTVTFSFVGKKGVEQKIDLKDRRLAQLVKKCKDIPGYDLFQYFDENGERQTVESGDVNDYLRDVTAHDFTAKDFRTWGGTVRMVECLERVIDADAEIDKEKGIKEAVKEVAKGLGNTPTVCSKYYIHPEVVNLFREDKLMAFLKKHDPEKSKTEYLSSMEVFVLKMLEKSLKV